ncbi:hypothetical protein BHE74_00052818, partial [Ensete ventricosum]
MQTKVCNFDPGRYIPVRQVTGTRTAHYRVVSLKIDCRWSISVVGGRLKKKSTVGGRLRKKKGRIRGKEKKKRGRKNTSPAHRPRRLAVACARGEETAAFSPARGDGASPRVGRRSRR